MKRGLISSNKYGAQRTSGRGPTGVMRLYDSKKEARGAIEMNAEKSAGLILDWVPQPGFEIGRDENGKAVRYRADALAILEVYEDGTFRGRLVDYKGKDTEASRAKRAALRARHLNVVIL
jgi:hypothetical protein